MTSSSHRYRLHSPSTSKLNDANTLKFCTTVRYYILQCTFACIWFRCFDETKHSRQWHFAWRFTNRRMHFNLTFQYPRANAKVFETNRIENEKKKNVRKYSNSKGRRPYWIQMENGIVKRPSRCGQIKYTFDNSENWQIECSVGFVVARKKVKWKIGDVVQWTDLGMESDRFYVKRI